MNNDGLTCWLRADALQNRRELRNHLASAPHTTFMVECPFCEDKATFRRSLDLKQHVSEAHKKIELSTEYFSEANGVWLLALKPADYARFITQTECSSAMAIQARVDILGKVAFMKDPDDIRKRWIEGWKRATTMGEEARSSYKAKGSPRSDSKPPRATFKSWKIPKNSRTTATAPKSSSTPVPATAVSKPTTISTKPHTIMELTTTTTTFMTTSAPTPKPAFSTNQTSTATATAPTTIRKPTTTTTPMITPAHKPALSTTSTATATSTTTIPKPTTVNATIASISKPVITTRTTKTATMSTITPAPKPTNPTSTTAATTSTRTTEPTGPSIATLAITKPLSTTSSPTTAPSTTKQAITVKPTPIDDNSSKYLLLDLELTDINANDYDHVAP